MWEQAPICGIDSSILSKVLNGKRSFTPHQLSVFCKVLKIKQGNRDFLFYCFHKDQCSKSGVEFNTPFITPSGTHLFVEGLMHQANNMFNDGKWKELHGLSEVLAAYLQEHASITYQQNPEDPLITAYQRAMYLYAKSVFGTTSQDKIVKKMRTIVQAIKQYPNSTSTQLIPGYTAAFRSSAYRILGVFPSPRNATFNPKTAALSGRYAAKAVSLLPSTDLEYIFALRDVIDSSIGLGERETFLNYLKTAKQAIFRSDNNALGYLHLATTLGKGIATFGLGDPFTIKLRAERHFNRTLAGTKLLELSNLKTELEIYVALKTKKDSHIERKIQKASTLADEESVRHKAIITRLAEQL